MLRTFIIFLAFVALIVGKEDTNFLCTGCVFAVGIVENQLKKIETVTKKDLTDFANSACRRVPKLEVFETLCSKVKDDLIDIAIQLIESLERQIEGNVTCKAIGLCS